MAPPAEPRGGPLGGGWSGPWDSCVRLVFGMGGRRAGCERAPGATGRMGGVPAWKEMEEGASGWPFPSLPSSKPGARARGARVSSLDRWAGEPVARVTGGRVGREWCRGTRGEASTSPSGAERGERMLLQRARELRGLAAGKTRKVWVGEENLVSGCKALRVG